VVLTIVARTDDAAATDLTATPLPVLPLILSQNMGSGALPHCPPYVFGP